MIVVFFIANFTYAKIKINTESIFSGLSVEWKFDENSGTVLSDSSGNSISGTLYSTGKTLPAFVPGVFGNAISLNGANQYARSDSTIASIGVANQPYTISSWVKPNGNKVSDGNIVYIASRSDGHGWCVPMLLISRGRFNAVSYSGGTPSVLSSRTGASTKSWYNVVHVWDPSDSGRELKIYVNGVLEGSKSQASYDASGSPDYLFVGLNSPGCIENKAPLNAKVDDVRIYDHALNAQQVSELYTRRTVKIKTSPVGNLFGYWPLDSYDNSGVFKDESGNDRNGTYTGTQLPVDSGHIGNAVSLNGTNFINISGTDYVTFPQLTVSAWFKANTLTGDNPRIVSNSHTDDPGSPNGFQLMFNNGGTDGFFDVGNGSKEYKAAWNYPLNAGQWYHYVGTYDGSNIKAYIDGQEVGSSSFTSGDIASSMNTINIGRNPFYGGDYFNGSIDDVRIYTRALTDQEILTLYNSSVAKINNSKNNKITDGLIGLWSFDGPDINWTTSSDAIIKDRSGQNNDGSVFGMSRKNSPVIGVIGQALNFNGTDSCVVTSSPILNNLSKFTIAGWIYPHSLSPAGFFGQNDTTEFGFDGDGNITGWNQGIGNVSWNAASLALNKWHHVAFSGDKSQEVLYVDGALVSSRSGAVSGVSGYNFNIGGCGIWDPTGDFFNGKIDDVRAYNRALSLNEIKQLYLMGK